MNKQLRKSLYLGNSSLQYHIINRQGRCIEHGHHHNQHVWSTRGTVRSKVEEHANPVLIVGRHGQDFTWRQMGHSQSGAGRRSKRRTVFTFISQAHHSLLPALLGLIASRGTCTLPREMSAALAGLPCSGGWQGDREWNSGLPGAEPRLWALAWDRAGEPGAVCWSTEAKEGESCLVMRGGTAAGIPKLLPLTIIWLDRLNITLKGSLWEHKAPKMTLISKQILTSVKQAEGETAQKTLYLLLSEKPIMARSCKFWRLCTGSAGGAAGPEGATPPNIPTVEAGICRECGHKVVHYLLSHISWTRITSCSQSALDAPAGKSTDWTLHSIRAWIGCSET